MRSYSIFEAKNKLSELIRLVQESGSIIITNRGKPMAKLVPISDDVSLRERYRDLVEIGKIIEPKTGEHWRANKVSGAVKRFLESRD